MNNSVQTCSNCGLKMAGKFCNHCGQKRIEQSERTLKHLFGQLFDDLFNWDNRVWRTFGTLFYYPGKLTDAFAKGQRKKYLRPFQLFILANLIYFLVQPYSGFTGFNTNLNSQMNRQNYSLSLEIKKKVTYQVEDQLSEILKNEGSTKSALSPAQYQKRLNSHWWQYAKNFNNISKGYAGTLIFLMIPMLALVFIVLNIGKGVLVVDHWVFVIHLMAWHLLFVYSIYLPFITHGEQLLAVIWNWFGVDWSQMINHSPNLKQLRFYFHEHSASIISSIYVYFAIRRFYKDVWWSALVKTLLFAPAYIVIIVTYRIILFYLTYWSLQ